MSNKIIKPDFSFEKEIRKRGFALVIGCDEVGRGPLAGPVVAGACALKEHLWSDSFMNEILSLGINDSKKLSAGKRETLSFEIGRDFYTATGEADVSYINNYGIRPATEKAIRQAIIKLLYKALDKDDNITSKLALSSTKIIQLKPYLILDAFQVKYVPIIGLKHQTALTGADTKIISVSAASIIAKVYRDKIMKNLASDFPEYAWDKNSGYGTKDHIYALKKFGPCVQHRTKFIRNFQS